MARYNVFNRQQSVAVTAAEVRALARRCAPPEWRGATVNIVLTGDAEVIDLNRRFLGRTGPTDVMAFPIDEPGPHAAAVIGDVVVNAEHAAAEAAARGVTVDDELALYIVHGLLHLNGYDDHTPAERRRMYAREREILEAAGRRSVR